MHLHGTLTVYIGLYTLDILLSLIVTAYTLFIKKKQLIIILGHLPSNCSAKSYLLQKLLQIHICLFNIDNTSIAYFYLDNV